MTQLSAHQIAAYLLWAGGQQGIQLTNLEVLKMLYYAQGWHLALYKQPLFREAVRAWKQGPVVSSVYGTYKHNRSHPIDPPAKRPELSPPVAAHTDKILSVFGKCGATLLKRMTHAEEPWMKAREGYSPSEPSNLEIPRDDMKAFFEKLLRGLSVPKEFEWARNALIQRSEEEQARFDKSLTWVNETHGEALQRLAKWDA